MSKLSMILFSGFIIGAGGLFGSRVCAKMNRIFANNYFCKPFSMICKHALEATGIVCIFLAVISILCSRAIAKVARKVIERVMVYMVADHPIWRICNDPVHFYRFSLSKQLRRVPLGIKGFCAWIELREPLELVEFLKPFVRDLRNLTLRQLNQFHVISKENGLRFVDSVRNKSQSYFNTNCLLNPSNLYYTMKGAS